MYFIDDAGGLRGQIGAAHRAQAAGCLQTGLPLIFGGRDGPNVVANGFNTVQIYDPANNTWTSTESGSSVAPLPSLASSVA